MPKNTSTDVREKPRVQSVARAISIIYEVARAGPSGYSAQELSEKLGLPRQMVYHMVHTLCATDMLRKAAGRTYVLGIGALTLIQGYRRQSAAPEFLAQYAEQAAAATDETAYVVGWVDGEIVVLATARAHNAIQAVEGRLGPADDVHARASGKLLMAMAPEDELDRFLSTRPLNRRTANTITTREALDAELQKCRSNWIAVESEEYAMDLSCMALPIGPPPSQMAICISAPTARFHARFARNAEALRNIGMSVAKI